METLVTFAVKSAVDKMDAAQLRNLVTGDYAAIRERSRFD